MPSTHLKRFIHVIVGVGVMACLAMTQPARAQTLLRDAEIENALRELAAPMAGAAGLNLSQLRFFVVADSTLNAFVADSRTIVINSGLLLKLGDATELQAVLGHEMAHIANGHITRRMSNQRGANTIAGLGAVLAAAVAVSGNGQAAVGLMAGSASAAQRAFFVHTRAEEASADQSGVRYLARAGIDPEGMVRVMELFAGQEALSPGRQDPYVLTHPLSRDRVRAMKGFAAGYASQTKADPTADYWFQRAKGKLGAFLQNSSYTLRRVGKTDQSDTALMQRAVAYHMKPDAKNALKEIDRLLQKRPNDAYVHELRGQILLESRNFAAAVNAYAKAVQLAPKESLILSGYGRALLALDTSDGNRKALAALEKARARDPFDPRMLRDLAVAYAKAGNRGMASVATAERYAIIGDFRTAATHAERAMGLLPNGSTGARRAADIITAAKQAAKNK